MKVETGWKQLDEKPEDVGAMNGLWVAYGKRRQIGYWEPDEYSRKEKCAIAEQSGVKAKFDVIFVFFERQIAREFELP